ncbi:pherophorin-like ECM-glycoprotein SSG185 [Volvox carteri f. nagariensis]|uniref:Pherophorin-like ECM-glycoprotein SSG185 n=1 Tax=Volvox carteri f. nagariensis TaxID=3068 RepID=D8THT1_VOLCA|nr:pherophorin-like ECM-glycoprotein SSG185 [Volvox carteri f. nagariensis]EFJ53121.1 pherophorin-like ECM-glycoprotein SSG185 [Volvox carteri f. nagariensis]|eukprot:XP_002946126.1 pherophorin-like ECM-glycoprotein SSG185 [Volvox carteri f. nagariensis]
MSKLLLVALFGAIAVVATSAEVLNLNGRSLLNNDDPNAFPYCKCTYRQRRSPYRLKYVGAENNYKGNDWLCYSIVLDTTGTVCQTVPLTEPCCSADLYKIEFDVKPSCKGTVTRAMVFKGIDRTVGGVRVLESISTVGIDDVTGVPGAAILRIVKDLALPYSVVASFLPNGLPVCINRVPGSCTFPELFMDVNGTASCVSRSPSSYPWRVTVANVSAVTISGGAGERVCLKISVDNAAAATCNNGLGGCCSDGLEKVELFANGKCKGSILPFTLSNTAEIRSSFSWDSTRPVLKFTRLGLTYAQGVAGGSLCFNIKGAGCTKFADLCPGRGCTVAVFNNPDNTCCPRVGTIA